MKQYRGLDYEEFAVALVYLHDPADQCMNNPLNHRIPLDIYYVELAGVRTISYVEKFRRDANFSEINRKTCAAAGPAKLC